MFYRYLYLYNLNNYLEIKLYTKNSCEINGKCFSSNETSPLNSNHICNPSLNNNTWSLLGNFSIVCLKICPTTPRKSKFFFEYLKISGILFGKDITDFTTLNQVFFGKVS